MQQEHEGGSALASTSFDVGDFFALARRCIPSALLDDRGWRRLLDRMRDIPGSALLSAWATYEFRLWESEPSADFELSLWADKSKTLIDYFADRGRAASASPSAAALGAYLAQMSVDAWPPYAILEYDVCDLADGERPDPGLFISCDPHRSNADVPSPGEALDVLVDALGLQHDRSERETVEGVFKAMPPGAFVNLLGAMPSRQQRAVRVQVEGVEVPEVPAFLERIGWPGPVPLVMDTLTDLLTASARFALALDVAPDGPLPRVGLELSPFAEGMSCFDGWVKGTRRDWRPLFEHLVATGLCLPEKGEAVLACTGLNRLFSPRNMFAIFSAIYAPKITVSDNGVHAKAYTVMHMTPAS